MGAYVRAAALRTNGFEVRADQVLAQVNEIAPGAGAPDSIFIDRNKVPDDLVPMIFGEESGRATTVAATAGSM